MQIEVPITRCEGGLPHERLDTIAVEEPLEIRINRESLTVTMRTPGDDFALTAGLLFAEGIVKSREEISRMRHGTAKCDPDRDNLVRVGLAPDWRQRTDNRWQRTAIATSACGVCGKANLETVRCTAPPLHDSDWRVPVGILLCLSERMRHAQRVFDRTGGLHAAALFDREGTLLVLREDIGRHNAVDKVIGTELLAGHMPLDERILMVSGRTSFEIMQKAAMARIPVLCAVSAPSSLAIELAHALNITLIGFLRGETFNIYAHPERILCSPADKA